MENKMDAAAGLGREAAEINRAVSAVLLAVEDVLAENEALRMELRDERDRFDKLSDFELAEAKKLESCRAFYEKVNALPRCETCGVVCCTFRPRLGENTRFNCPLWKGRTE